LLACVIPFAIPYFDRAFADVAFEAQTACSKLYRMARAEHNLLKPVEMRYGASRHESRHKVYARFPRRLGDGTGLEPTDHATF
jgi:hypothetical protein